jgi:hypothetical protein
MLSDPDKSARVTGRYGQFLEVVRVPVDVAGALEIRAGLKLGEGLVLLVLLYEPEAELSLEPGPGGERERVSRCVPFRSSSSRALQYEGHGEPNKFFL